MQLVERATIHSRLEARGDSIVERTTDEGVRANGAAPHDDAAFGLLKASADREGRALRRSERYWGPDMGLLRVIAHVGPLQRAALTQHVVVGLGDALRRAGQGRVVVVRGDEHVRKFARDIDQRRFVGEAKERASLRTALVEPLPREEGADSTSLRVRVEELASVPPIHGARKRDSLRNAAGHLLKAIGAFR